MYLARLSQVVDVCYLHVVCVCERERESEIESAFLTFTFIVNVPGIVLATECVCLLCRQLGGDLKSVRGIQGRR